MDYNNTKGYYPNFDTLEVGGHKFTLKGCKEVVGHDDSLPYVGRLYIDGKQVCTLYNDGWGGETNITQILNESLLKKATDDIKGKAIPTFPWDNIKLPSDITLTNIQEIADLIACTCVEVNARTKKYGKKRTLVAFKGEKIRFINFTHELTKKDLEFCIKRCNEYIAQGFYIVNAPQMYVKDTI